MTHILLSPEDVIQEGDEMLLLESSTFTPKWTKAFEGDFGQHPISSLVWRRPIAPPVWIEVKSGVLPKPGQPFWGCDGRRVDCYEQGIDDPNDIVNLSLTSHWLPATIPDPPKADPSEAEKRWQELANTPGITVNGFDTFSPTESDADAMAVLRKCAEKVSHSGILIWPDALGVWTVESKYHDCVRAPTLNLAICKFALKIFP